MNVRRTSLQGRLVALSRAWSKRAPHWWPQVEQFLCGHRKEMLVVLALLLVLLGPFLLRPTDLTSPHRYDRRLVIMTPHHELIRQEFGHAFARNWKEKTGQTLYLDWRVFATSELSTLIKNDYTNAFQRHWQHDLQQPWSIDIASRFINPKTPANDPARDAFLKSNVGIGVDVFFGGGTFEFTDQAKKGTIVAADARTGAGPQHLRAQHPEWFNDNAIPLEVSGQPFYDKDMRWIGAALSSFGIVFNRDVLHRLGIDRDPQSWEDLADPRLMGQVALADPTKSGSVTTAFEMMIQQKMQDALKQGPAHKDRPRTPEQLEHEAVETGWLNGLSLIQRISANARYFTDSAPKIPLEVAKGDAAAGMCIDFYGRSTEELVRRADGTSRVGFVAPAGGTAISVDGIAMFRGAPDSELAEAFIEFVLSDAGQKLWNFRTGTPGGPRNASLRRLPIRKDFYTEANLANMADAHEEPFEKAKSFIYHPQWTGSAFGPLRFLIRTMFIDPHLELRDAWRTLQANSRPERALDVFGQMPNANYNYATGDLLTILNDQDKTKQVREARDTTARFRAQYVKAQGFAKQAR